MFVYFFLLTRSESYILFSFFFQLNQLQTQLKLEWPNVINGNDTEFWEYEWNKHGTCSISTYTQLPYFQRALSIKTQINLLNVLQNSGIVPDNTNPYDISRVVSAIKGGNNNLEPALMCTPPTRRSPLPYLKEIKLCLFPNGSTYMNCPAANRIINCNNNNKNQLLFPAWWWLCLLLALIIYMK